MQIEAHYHSDGPSALRPESSPKLILQPALRDIREHLLRLGADDRRLRFGRAVSDGFLSKYADQLSVAEGTVIGYSAAGRLCAMAELRTDGAGFGCDESAGEIALSVDRQYRGEGFGTELFEMLLVLARARGFCRLKVHCSADNEPMCAIAEAHATGYSSVGTERTYRFKIQNPANLPEPGVTEPMEDQP